jgi:hypothetical protein
VTRPTALRGMTALGRPAAAWAHLRLTAPAVLCYLAARGVGLVVLAVMSPHFDGHPLELLGSWDGRWFMDIVQHGYDTRLAYRPDGSLIETNVVFFPGYPLLLKAVSSVTGLEVLHAGIITSALAGVAGAWGIFAVGNELHGRTVGALLAVLWGMQTHAIVESMVYSESLFTALSAWCLYAVLRGRWLSAGVLCALAGLTRASAIVLVLVVVVAALADLRRRNTWRAAVCALVSPVGLVGYYAWVAHALGRADAWFFMQDEGWGSRFDGGWDSARTFVHLFHSSNGLEPYEVTAVLLVSIGLLVALAFLRPPLPLLAFAGGLLFITIGTAGYYHAKSRFLLPAFPLLLPIAIWGASLPRRLLGVAIASLTLLSALYGAYLLLIWPVSF